MKKYIEAGWDGYKVVCVPIAASETQVAEVRQAYFAGAAVLMQVIMRGLSKGRKAKPEDLRMLEELQAELSDFAESLDAKVLGTLDKARRELN